MQVAVDGPAGSGKSTVCKIIAANYNLTYLDTGAMYRSVAWCFNKFGRDIDVNSITFQFKNSGSGIVVTYNGVEYDVSEAIRTPEISAQVSSVASISEVRTIMTKRQQEYAEGNDVIMEGRDITTVVLPNAEIKIFLTASPEERATRRFAELEGKGLDVNYDEILKSIIERDEADSSREVAPLKQADDAIYVDTTGLTLDAVATKIGDIIQGKRG